MADAYDYQDAVFLHDAIEPPRKNHLGEQMYAIAWKRHLEYPVKHGDGFANERFISILCNIFTFKIDQRAAGVAASFIQWLGTNCGRAFVHTARSRADTPDGFIAAWAITNHRSLSVNGGVRTIEAVVGTPKRGAFGQVIEIPEVSIQDAEIVEMIAAYLGTADGRAFIDNTEEELEAASKILRERQDREHRAKVFAAQNPAAY